MKKALHLSNLKHQKMQHNYYVSPTGSDTNSGTHGEPFKTITKGISVLVAGDTPERCIIE